MSDPPEEINEPGTVTTRIAPIYIPPDEYEKLPEKKKQELNKINDFVLKETEQSIKLLEPLKQNVLSVSYDIGTSFRDTRVMYWVLFLLGVGLVVAAVPVALYTQKELFSLVFGSVGVIDIVTFFLKDPPQQLQKSRANLTKLQAAYYQWLLDVANWSNVLYSEGIAGKLDVKKMKEASDSYVASFTAVMKAINGGSEGATAAKEDKGSGAKT